MKLRAGGRGMPTDNEMSKASRLQRITDRRKTNSRIDCFRDESPGTACKSIIEVM